MEGPSSPPETPDRVEAAFERIRVERMAGLPILNPALSVSAVGFRLWNDDWVGVLVTPWSMNLVVVPKPGAEASWPRPGEFVHRQFPSGRYPFLGCEERELGRFLSCSLFSPVFEFVDQSSALDTAGAVLDALFAPPAPAAPAGSDRAGSRRAFLGLAG